MAKRTTTRRQSAAVTPPVDGAEARARLANSASLGFLSLLAKEHREAIAEAANAVRGLHPARIRRLAGKVHNWASGPDDLASVNAFRDALEHLAAAMDAAKAATPPSARPGRPLDEIDRMVSRPHFETGFAAASLVLGVGTTDAVRARRASGVPLPEGKRGPNADDEAAGEHDRKRMLAARRRAERLPGVTATLRRQKRKA
jgi:hypothetical protein